MISHDRMSREMLMSSARIACALAVVAALCVLAAFFFPGIEGPYSAVNGPVTALLSMRAASVLRLGIVHAALTIIWSLVASSAFLFASLCWIWSNQDSCYSSAPPICNSTLRC